MKKCSGCKKKLYSSSFYKRKTGERAGEHYEKCKDCMRARGRKYYLDNKVAQLPLALLRRRKYHKEKRGFIIKAKNRPCADCGKIYPGYVMDFDHREGSGKIVDISRAVTANWSLEKIKLEIMKCDVICSNCHRIRTYKNKLG